MTTPEVRTTWKYEGPYPQNTEELWQYHHEQIIENSFAVNYKGSKNFGF